MPKIIIAAAEMPRFSDEMLQKLRDAGFVFGPQPGVLPNPPRWLTIVIPIDMGGDLTVTKDVDGNYTFTQGRWTEDAPPAPGAPES